MKNLSLNKESLLLKKGYLYIVIDSLYLNNIRNGLFDIDVNANVNEVIHDIRVKIFPYTDTPFAEYKADDDVFILDKIKKISYSDVFPGDNSIFSTDTGLIFFLRKTILTEFISSFDYDELVDSTTDINMSYWDDISSKYDHTEIGLILSPGINAGIDFDGSGTYRIL